MYLIIILGLMLVFIALLLAFFQLQRRRLAMERSEQIAPLPVAPSVPENSPSPSAPSQETGPGFTTPETAAAEEDTDVAVETEPASDTDTASEMDSASTPPGSRDFASETAPLFFEQEELQASQGESLNEALPRIQVLRDQHDFEAALRLCREHLPRLQAFQQMLITLRAQITAMRREGHDITTPLIQLYNTAVVGESYRKLRPSSTDPDLARRVCGFLEDFHADFTRTGYAGIRSLTAGDISMLVKRFGVATAHELPELDLPIEEKKSSRFTR